MPPQNVLFSHRAFALAVKRIDLSTGQPDWLVSGEPYRLNWTHQRIKIELLNGDPYIELDWTNVNAGEFPVTITIRARLEDCCKSIKVKHHLLNRAWIDKEDSAVKFWSEGLEIAFPHHTDKKNWTYDCMTLSLGGVDFGKAQWSSGSVARLNKEDRDFVQGLKTKTRDIEIVTCWSREIEGVLSHFAALLLANACSFAFYSLLHSFFFEAFMESEKEVERDLEQLEGHRGVSLPCCTLGHAVDIALVASCFDNETRAGRKHLRVTDSLEVHKCCPLPRCALGHAVHIALVASCFENGSRAERKDLQVERKLGGSPMLFAPVISTGVQSISLWRHLVSTTDLELSESIYELSESLEVHKCRSFPHCLYGHAVDVPLVAACLDMDLELGESIYEVGEDFCGHKWLTLPRWTCGPGFDIAFLELRLHNEFGAEWEVKR